MSDETRYKKALEYASEKHKGQFRVGGLPYITHPVAVAEIVAKKGGDTDARIVALFHDLLEDTDATEEDIFRLGNEKILHSVKLLTKYEGIKTEDYIAGIRGDETAFLVKCADRLHNLLSAVCEPDEFKIRYIEETLEWYSDFCPEIISAVKALQKTVGTDEKNG